MNSRNLCTSRKKLHQNRSENQWILPETCKKNVEIFFRKIREKNCENIEKKFFENYRELITFLA